MAFSVVLLPTPLAPNNATICPSSTLSEIPVQNANDVQIGNFNIIEFKHDIRLV
jgi:hypothetical protein